MVHKKVNLPEKICKTCQLPFSWRKKWEKKHVSSTSLYWHFLDEKKQHFTNNQRMSMMLALHRKMKPEELAATKEKAILIIEDIYIL